MLFNILQTLIDPFQPEVCFIYLRSPFAFLSSKCFNTFVDVHHILLHKLTLDQLSLIYFFPQMASYTIARATRSGVMGPVLTEIHRSSVLLDEFFFFFASDLVDAVESLQQQLQHLLAWRQQQQ